jgi:hypothetical protein
MNEFPFRLSNIKIMNRKIPLFAICMAVLCAGCTFLRDSANRTDLWGDPAATAAVSRTIYISPSTSYVNVGGGEIVQFVSGSQSFSWNFDGPTAGYVFDLRKVAPAGVLDHAVTAFVDVDPRYAGGR